MKFIYYFFLLGSLFWISACNKVGTKAKIDRIVIIVIDGVRNSDLHDDSLIEFNQGYQELKNMGLYFSNFMNNGVTNTQNGMSNIVTGHQEELVNNGSETSSFPNIFHYYLAKNSTLEDKAWIITSKDKLETLKNTEDINFSNAFRAKSNCGISGLNSGYRDDSLTYLQAINTLENHTPNLAFIAFKEPDYSGHKGNWNEYKLGMKNSIEYSKRIVEYINLSPYYTGRTLVLITNDHGRHLNGIADGFVSHGDNCMGCRHITLLAISPNLVPNSLDSN